MSYEDKLKELGVLCLEKSKIGWGGVWRDRKATVQLSCTNVSGVSIFPTRL